MDVISHGMWGGLLLGKYKFLAGYSYSLPAHCLRTACPPTGIKKTGHASRGAISTPSLHRLTKSGGQVIARKARGCLYCENSPF
ncbi:MAG: hypothetical protein PHS56_01040 [Eubacteriales bacterium]|nr:hypothetical protein [Eubacteriales bacterium]MDD4768460.1 hypothetical protein [Eubacteriales bacterium]